MFECEQVIEVQFLEEGDALADGFCLLLGLRQTGSQFFVEGLHVVHFALERFEFSLELPHGRRWGVIAEINFHFFYAGEQFLAIVGVMWQVLQCILCDFDQHGIELGQKVDFQSHLIALLLAFREFLQEGLILYLDLDL